MRGPKKRAAVKFQASVYLASKIKTTLGASITLMLTQSGSIR